MGEKRKFWKLLIIMGAAVILLGIIASVASFWSKYPIGKLTTELASSVLIILLVAVPILIIPYFVLVNMEKILDKIKERISRE